MSSLCLNQFRVCLRQATNVQPLALLQVWTQVSKLFLTTDVPFEVHLMVHKHVFREWDQHKLGPAPLWYPTQNTMAGTNVAKFMRKYRALLAQSELRVRDERWFLQSALVRDWRVLHALSVQRPAEFWHVFLQVCCCSAFQILQFYPQHSCCSCSLTRVTSPLAPVKASPHTLKPSCKSLHAVFHSTSASGQSSVDSVSADESVVVSVLKSSGCFQELGVRFYRPPHCVLEKSTDGNPDSCQWFSGALLNIAECALQVNDPDAPAIVYAHGNNPNR